MVSVDDIIQGHTPEVRLIVGTLRDLVRQTAPASIESAHASWHSIHFNDPQVGYFCGIFPLADSVNLIFEFGILLPDPDHILEGSGKQMRSIRIQSIDTIPTNALKKLIIAALALPGNQKDKLAMIRSGARPL